MRIKEAMDALEKYTPKGYYPERDACIYVRYHHQNRTLKDVADWADLSTERTRQIIKRITTLIERMHNEN